MSAATDPRPQGGTFFTSHASSDRGQARPGNEDAFYRGVTVFAVADGMGGHQAGEVASETAVAPLAEIDGREWPSAVEAERALADAVRAANTDVVRQAATNPEWRGMGTTLTAVLVRGGRLHVAHVGDSRAYLYRPAEGLSQLTTDHTLVEQLVRDGRISRDEIATHPQRSVITRAIGVEVDVEVDTLAPLELQPGDQVLLCSDGLSGPVEDQEIGRILAETPDGDEACYALVQAANRAGGPDNITVVLLRVIDPSAGNGSATSQAAEPPVEEQAQPPHRVSTATEAERDFDAERLAQLAADREPVRPGADLDDGRGPVRRLLAGTVGLLVVVVVLAAIGAGVYFVLSRSWFVGLADGEVVIFRGLPQELGGIALSRVEERTGLQADDLPALRVSRLEEGIGAQDLADARQTVAELRRFAQPETGSDPSPSPSSIAPTAPETPAAAAPGPTLFQPEPLNP